MRRHRRALLLLVVLVIGIASAAALLLSAASPAEVQISCGPDGARVHPRRCLVTGITGEAGESVPLVGLHWSSWGGPKARARGFALDLDGTRWAATVLLYGKMACDGEPFYRSLRLGHKGHTVAHLGTIICPS